MALIDDPKAWILQMFEREEREGRGADCALFVQGVRPPDLPLEEGERVFGIYKQKYYFTPVALLIGERAEVLRIPWASVRHCSSRHGEGKTFSEVILTDGRQIRVRVGDMATGWSGRISQLYHQMIERYGAQASLGKPLVPAKEFFEKVTDPYSIAPNLEPHPTLESFQSAVNALEQTNDGTRVFMDLVEEEDEFVSDALVIVTPRPAEDFEHFVREFEADGILEADENTMRGIEGIRPGMNVWRVAWD